MGILIIPVEGAKSGSEARYQQLDEELARLHRTRDPRWLVRMFQRSRTARAREDVERRKLEVKRELHLLRSTIAEALGAPRIGVDSAADDWFRGNWHNWQRIGRPPDRPFEVVVLEHYGEAVWDLMAGVPDDVRRPGSGSLLGVNVPQEIENDFDAQIGQTIPPDAAIAVADSLERYELARLDQLCPELECATVAAVLSAARRSTRSEPTSVLLDASFQLSDLGWFRRAADKGFSFEFEVL